MTYNPSPNLKRNGRPVDNDFPDEERLFFRIEEAVLADGEKIPPSAVPFPNTSMNRERYSLPEDVLLGKQGFLVYGTAVAQVRINHQTTSDRGASTYYRLCPIHVPLEDNYSHTELRVFKNDERSHAPNLTRNVKRHFRGKIIEALARL